MFFRSIYKDLSELFCEFGEAHKVPGDDVEDDDDVGDNPAGTHVNKEGHEGVAGNGHEDGHDAGLDGGAGHVVHDMAGCVDRDKGGEESDDVGDGRCCELFTLENAQEVVDGCEEHRFSLFIFIFKFLCCFFLWLLKFFVQLKSFFLLIWQTFFFPFACFSVLSEKMKKKFYNVAFQI